jgi:hypothetical protein
MGFIIARIIAIVLLLWALDKHPYGYYTLLRFVVCGVTAYSAYLAVELKKNGWAWTFGIIALLFNPIIPFHLGRDIWQIVDVGVAILLLVSLFLLKEPRIKSLDRQK